MGIFLVKGTKIRLINLSFNMQDESVSAGKASFDLAYDTCIAWARIARQHNIAADAAMSARREAWGVSTTNGDQKGALLEAEFYASMQCVVASAVCLDALYDHLIRLACVEQATINSWNAKKTARYARVAHAITQTFPVANSRAQILRASLKAVYTLRDAAVHPSSSPSAPVPHPDIGTSTEWKFATFRGDVADSFSSFALGLLWDISHFGKYKTQEIEKFANAFRNQLIDLLPDGRPLPKNDNVGFRLPPKPVRREQTKPVQ